MHAVTFHENEVMNLKESEDMYRGGMEGRNRKEEML